MFTTSSKERVHDGFFIEAGADDFVTTSNSLYFEARGYVKGERKADNDEAKQFFFYL